MICAMPSTGTTQRRRSGARVESGAVTCGADAWNARIVPQRRPASGKSSRFGARIAAMLESALPCATLAVLASPVALAACAATGSGGPVLPGLVNAPPPPMAAEDTLPLGVVWSWQSTQMSDGARHRARGPERYTLEFRPGGTVQRARRLQSRQRELRAQRQYARHRSDRADEDGLPADTRDADFLKGLGAVSGHLIRGNDLVLTLKVDSGSMRFTSSRP